MATLEGRLLSWASETGVKLALLAESTGAVENWLRAEAIIAARGGRLGRVGDVQGEIERDDLTFCNADGSSTRIEFKVAWNNKNLFGGHAGTGGIARDIVKLTTSPQDHRFSLVFFNFYDTSFVPRGPAYYKMCRKEGVRLQPLAEEKFHRFARNLAAEVTSRLCVSPEPVRPAFHDDGRWFGVWLYRVE